jgi:hypothetical protein
MSASDYSFKTVNWMPVVSFGQTLFGWGNTVKTTLVTAVLRCMPCCASDGYSESDKAMSVHSSQ